jgi:hypothetical protein
MMFGYLTIHPLGTTNPKYMAGMLITDDYGLPIDFRYTEPVTPSRIQQVLYGQGLAHYVKSQILWPTLLNDCSDYDLAYVFTQDATILQCQAQTVGLICIRDTNLETMADFRQDISPTECLLQLVKTGPPVKTAWQSHLDEPALIEILKRLAQQMVLLEPFDRVQAALKMLGTEMVTAV